MGWSDNENFIDINNYKKSEDNLALLNDIYIVTITKLCQGPLALFCQDQMVTLKHEFR